MKVSGLFLCLMMLGGTTTAQATQSNKEVSTDQEQWVLITEKLNKTAEMDRNFDLPYVSYSGDNLNMTIKRLRDELQENGCAEGDYSLDLKTESYSEFTSTNKLGNMILGMNRSTSNEMVQSEEYIIGQVDMMVLIGKAFGDTNFKHHTIEASGDCRTMAYSHTHYIFDGAGLSINVAISSYAD
jgi:hypothetical protein